MVRVSERTKSSLQNDAVEFCESTAAKWSAYEKRHRIVRSLDELLTQCSKEPEEESMGVCCRPGQTGTPTVKYWRSARISAHVEENNIVFDFLAVRPDPWRKSLCQSPAWVLLCFVCSRTSPSASMLRRSGQRHLGVCRFLSKKARSE